MIYALILQETVRLFSTFEVRAPCGNWLVKILFRKVTIKAGSAPNTSIKVRFKSLDEVVLANIILYAKNVEDTVRTFRINVSPVIR